jgi:DNA adenine methylase
MSKKLKTPVRRYGGKSKLLPHLLPLIPEHKTYVEAFAGSAALFFAKPISPVEIINDLDSGIVTFFSVLRDEEKYGKLVRLLSLTPYSREVFEEYRDSWDTAADDVHRAHRWFVRMRMSFSGQGKNFSYSKTDGRNGMGTPVRAFLSGIDRLPKIHERLKGVQIEHEDFRSLIKRYDAPATFFYLDPPYVHSTRRSTKDYEHEMTDRDHEELVEILLGLSGKAMLSGYANHIYEPLERAGWTRHDFVLSCNVINGHCSSEEKPTRTESVWIKN